jgi:hypothetical protein
MMDRNRLCIVIALVSAITTAGFAQSQGTVSFGMHVMLGGRYDDVRMCVSSPAGAKGGLIADIMFDTRYQINDRTAVVFHLPVMRPILFAAAFKMLQLEPAIQVEWRTPLSEKADIVAGPALGVSFHYGPDYHSDRDNRGESFFAAGPLVSGLAGIGFGGQSGAQKVVGLRAFYIPLFAKGRAPGTVLGGALEGHFSFTR